MNQARRISALACVAALTAGAYAVPSANAATVGAPKDGVCALSLTDGERSYLQSLPRVDQADYGRTLAARAFETAFPDAAREGKKLSDDPGAFAAAFGDNPSATSDRWIKRIADTGVDYDAASFYVGYLFDTALIEVHASPALLKFWEQVDRATTNGTINASAGDEVSDVNESFLSGSEFAAKLAKSYPSMPAAQRDAWTAAYTASQATQDAQRVGAFQAAFTQTRIMCGLGGGVAKLPTDVEQGVTYSATPVRTPENSTTTFTEGNTTVTTTVSGTARTTVSANVNISSFADTDIKPSTQATVEPVAAKTSGTNVGAIIGVIVAILAVVGIGGAAFALTR